MFRYPTENKKPKVAVCTCEPALGKPTKEDSGTCSPASLASVRDPASRKWMDGWVNGWMDRQVIEEDTQ